LSVEVFEQLDDTLYPADLLRLLHGKVGFMVGNQAHQVDHAGLGDHLDAAAGNGAIGEQAGFQVGGNQAVLVACEQRQAGPAVNSLCTTLTRCTCLAASPARAIRSPRGTCPASSTTPL